MFKRLRRLISIGLITLLIVGLHIQMPYVVLAQNYDNLVSNPGFESDFSGWNSNAGVIDNTSSFSGVKGLKMVGDQNNEWNVTASSGNINVTQSTDLRLDVFTKDNLTGGAFLVGILCCNSSGAGFQYLWHTTTRTGGNWLKQGKTFQLPEGTASVRVYLWLSSNASGTVWVDDVILNQDGSGNLLLNPGFESGSSNWNLRNAILDTSNYYDGTKSVKLSGDPDNAWNVFESSYPISANAGNNFKISAYTKGNLTAGKLKMGLRFIKADGTTSISYSWYDVGNTVSWTQNGVVFACPAETAYVQVYFYLTQDAVGSVWVDNASIYQVQDSFKFWLTEKHKFSDEATVNANYQVNLSVGSLSDYKVRVERYNFGDTSPVYTKEYTSLSASFTDYWALSDIPKGYSIYKAYLIKKSDNSTLMAITQELQKTDSYVYPTFQNTSTVTIDANKAVRINGDIFIPRFIHGASPIDYSAVKARGFNTVYAAERDGYTIAQQLDEAQAAGLKAVVALWTDITNVDLNYIQTRVNTNKNHPALLAWCLNDEPDGNGVPAANMIQGYNMIKSLDTSHPVILNLCFRSALRSGAYTAATDIVGSDPYPIPNWPISDVIEATDLCAAKNKGTSICVQSFGRYANWSREPLPEETRAMTWLSINHGSKFVQYYSYLDKDGQGGYLWNMPNDNPALWASFKVLNAELDGLKDVIGAPDVTQDVFSSSAAIDLKKRTFNGKNYLFAVNKTNSDVTATFSGTGLNVSGVELINEYRSKSVTNNSFTDTFSPYMVHIYKYNTSLKEWEYSSDAQNWTVGNQINGFGWQTGGYIGGTAIGSDPFIYSGNNLGISIGAAAKTVKVCMKNSTSSTTGQIYFTTNADTVWDEAKSKTFTITANDSSYREYIIDMSTVPGWTGALKQLRLDPSEASGSFSVDYVRIQNSWEYASTMENWTAQNNISGFAWQAGGYVGGTITGGDPQIISANNLNLDINGDNKIIEIKMKNSTASITGQIFFTTNADTVWDEAKSKSFTITANDSSYREYIIDMSTVPGWTGVLKQLRFDPDSGVTSGAFSIDYIKIR